jgi:hypothetical protein
MPIVKKIKVKIEDSGDESIIKISIDAKGEFSADLPLFVRAATGKTISQCKNMIEAIDLVYVIVAEYRQLRTTEKRVILIRFKRTEAPFLNSGVSLAFNYAIANKIQFGNQISYKLMRKRIGGKLEEIGNELPYADYHYTQNGGVIGGKSVELEYSDETLQAIESINSKLEMLSSKLYELCNSEKLFMQLVEGTLKALSSGENN